MAIGFAPRASAPRCGTKQKPPGSAPGGFVPFANKVSLSPYRNAGLSHPTGQTGSMPMPLGAVGITSFTQTASGPLKYEVLRRLAQGVDAVLLLPGGRVGESPAKLQNTTHECFWPFRLGADSNFRSFGLHKDLGTGAAQCSDLAVILKSLPLRLRVIGFPGARPGYQPPAPDQPPAQEPADRKATSFSARPAPPMGPGLLMLN